MKSPACACLFIVSIPLTACLAAPPAPDFLRGPRVLEGDTPSLVTYTMTGKMELLRGRPEIAAVELLAVPAEARSAVAALADRRTRELAEAMIDHLDLVTRIVDANARAEGERASDLIDTLRDRIEPRRTRDVLFEDVVAAIGEEHRVALRRMVDEYWDALIDRRLLNADADPRKVPQRRRDRVAANQERGLFHRELRAAYDRSLRATQQSLAAIYDAIDPTDDQRAEIRARMLADLKRTGLDRTPADRRATFRRIYDSLDAERRALLFDYLTRVVVPDA